MRTRHISCIKIEDSSDSACQFDIKPVKILVNPFFLLGGCHSDPQNIRVYSINGLNHCIVIA